MPQPDSGDNCCDCPSRASPCDDCGGCVDCCDPESPTITVIFSGVSLCSPITGDVNGSFTIPSVGSGHWLGTGNPITLVGVDYGTQVEATCSDGLMSISMYSIDLGFGGIFAVINVCALGPASSIYTACDAPSVIGTGGTAKIECPGACCFPDNTCVDTTEEGCTGTGVFLGLGTSCDDNPCDLLHIGCCNNNDTAECTVTLDTDCFSPFAFTEGDICCFGDPGLSYCCDFTSEICCGNAGCCNTGGGEECCPPLFEGGDPYCSSIGCL